MTHAARDRTLRSLQSVRALRVRSRQAVLAMAERELREAAATQRHRERQLDAAVGAYQRYEREVFDGLVSQGQPQSVIREAMVRLKGLGVEIEVCREWLDEARADTEVRAARHSLAVRELQEAHRADVKVSDLLDRVRAVGRLETQRREDDPA
jgi:multidrug resistance efflux pump